MKTKVLLVDVCDTLFRANTTFDFIKYIMVSRPGNRGKKIIFNLFASPKSPLFWLLLLLNKLMSVDLHKRAVLFLLRGMSREDLEKISEEYTQICLLTKKNKKAFDIISQYPDHRLILLSASIDPVVKAIATFMHAEYLSSELHYRNDICLGKCNTELLATKYEYLRKYISIEQFDSFVVISDNETDVDLLRLPNVNFYAICNTPRQGAFWKRHTNVICVDNTPTSVR